MTGDKFTIRTSTGLLFGEFESRDDAWAVIERIRRDVHHRESALGAAVVPLLAGVTPKSLHPAWLSDEGEASELERLKGTLERRTAQLAAIDEELRAFGIEHPLGRAGVADVCAMASGAREELEQMRIERDAARAEVDQLRAELKNALSC